MKNCDEKKGCAALTDVLSAALNSADVVLETTLWTYAIAVFLFLVVFHIFESALTLFFIGVLFSAIGSLPPFFSAVWREYPFWLDVDLIARIRFRVSVPCCLVFFLTSCALARQYGVLAAIVAFMIGVALTYVWGKKTLQIAETFARTLREYCGGFNKSISTCDDALSTHFLEDDKIRSILADDALTDPCSDDVEKTTTMTMRRELLTDGEDVARGTARVDFESGSTVGVLNIAFCPPFRKTPHFEFEQVDGTELLLSVTSLQNYGVRIEARRSPDSSAIEQSETATLEFYANLSRCID